MNTILKLFGRSPFAPLQSHMHQVSACVEKIGELFQALEKREAEQLDLTAKLISKLEHLADLTKNDIRNHLPSSLYLPIEKNSLLEILSIQDSLADKAEDIAVLLTLKQLEIYDFFRDDLFAFLEKNLQAFFGAKRLVDELPPLLESSFGGSEASKVKAIVNKIALNEHEADLLQRKLLKKLFQAEEKMPYTTFFLWHKIFSAIGELSNLSEKLANRMRATLEPME